MAKSSPVDLAFRAILTRCEGSFRYFLENYLITRDDHDQESPAKPFPKIPYIGFLADEFQHGPEIVYIAKSRQMMVSWMLAAYTLWVCLFKPLKVVLFQSKKEEDAAKMIYVDALSVGRVSFMLSRLPEWMRVCRNERGGYTRLPDNLDNLFANGKMTLPNGSQAIALAQGAAQVESWSPYLFINDEASLQDEWASAQAAASPALAGGGRGVTVGTMRMPSDYGEEIEPSWYVKPDTEGRGIARFTTMSGIPGIRLHYSADPGKDPLTPEGQEWVQIESQKMKGGLKGWRWRQHMEIDPLAGAGEIVLPPANDEKAWQKIQCPPIPYGQMVAERWSFDAGLDYGARNATVWLVFGMAPTGVRYLVHELSIPAKDVGGIPGICRLMHESPFLKHVNGTICADPTVMFNADQNALGGLVTKADLFAANGVFLTKAPGKGQSADDVLHGRLLGYYWDGWEEPETFYPLLRIFSSCRQTLQNLPLIRYQDWAEGLKAQKAFKEAMEQKYCNEWDAMKYAESAWPSVPTYSAPAAEGTYSWYLKRARSFDRKDADIYHRSGVTQCYSSPIIRRVGSSAPSAGQRLRPTNT